MDRSSVVLLVSCLAVANSAAQPIAALSPDHLVLADSTQREVAIWNVGSSPLSVDSVKFLDSALAWTFEVSHGDSTWTFQHFGERLFRVDPLHWDLELISFEDFPDISLGVADTSSIRLLDTFCGACKAAPSWADDSLYVFTNDPAAPVSTVSIDLAGFPGLIATEFVSPASNFLSVYPNPTELAVTVRVSGSGHVQRLLVFDMLGRVRQSAEVAPGPAGSHTDLTIDTAALDPGIYFVRVVGTRFQAGTFVKR